MERERDVGEEDTSEISRNKSVNAESDQEGLDEERYLLPGFASSNSRIQRIWRFLHHPRLPFRLGIMASIKQNDQHLWLSGRAVPLEDESVWGRLIFWKFFLNGAGFYIKQTWPISFMGLLLHDFWTYAYYPEQRFGNTLSQIILGTSPNTLTWSAHLGSPYFMDLAQDWDLSFWLPTLLVSLLFMAPLLGLINWWLHYSYRKNSFLVESDEFNLTPNLCDDLFKFLLPGSKLRSVLNRAAFSVLWNGNCLKRDSLTSGNLTPPHEVKEEQDEKNVIEKRLEDDKKFLAKHGEKPQQMLEDFVFCRQGESRIRQQFNFINSVAKEHYLWARYKAIFLLTEIAGSFVEKDLTNYVTENYRSRQELRTMRTAALNTLRDLSKNGNFLARIFANYGRWQLGIERKIVDRKQWSWIKWHWILLFLFYDIAAKSLVWYANIRYWEMAAFKLKDIITYCIDRANCLAQGMEWTYLPQRAEMACTVCGDWSFVFIQNRSTTQGCLDGLLAYPRTVGWINQKLQRLGKHPGVERVDLSQQNITGWTDSEWSTFFDHIKIISTNELTTFNLSQPLPLSLPLSSEKVAILGQFLQQIPSAQVDMTNLSLAKESEIVISALSATRTVNQLILSGNALEDDAVVALNILFPNQELQTLRLDNNVFGDAALNLLITQGFAKGNHIQILSLRNNMKLGFDLQALAEFLPNSTMTHLDLANTAATVDSLKQLVQFLPESSLRYLNLGNLTIDDVFLSQIVDGLSSASLNEINFEGNPLTDNGVIRLVNTYFAKNNTLNRLNLRDVKLTDIGLRIITPSIKGLRIEMIDLSSNKFTVGTFDSFIQQAIPGSELRCLFAEDLNLSGHVVLALANVLTNSSNQLTEIYFAGNAIAGEGVVLAQATTQSAVEVIDLSRNNLPAAVGEAFAIVANRNAVRVLNLSQNQQVNSSMLLALTRTITASPLEEILLDEVNFTDGDEACVQWAEHFIHGIPDRTALADAHLSRDFRRALQKAQPATHLTQLALSNTNIEDRCIRVICRTEPFTLIPRKNLRITPNPITYSAMAIEGCDVSSAMSLRSGMPMPFLGVKYSALSSRSEMLPPLGAAYSAVGWNSLSMISLTFSMPIFYFMPMALASCLFVLLVISMLIRGLNQVDRYLQERYFSGRNVVAFFSQSISCESKQVGSKKQLEKKEIIGGILQDFCNQF